MRDPKKTKTLDLNSDRKDEDVDQVIVEAPNLRLSSVSVNLDKYTESLRKIISDLAEYVAHKDGVDYETTYQDFLGDLSFYVQSTQRNAEQLRMVVADAARRAGITVPVQIVAHSVTQLPDDHDIGQVAFSVYVTPKLDFTVFLGDKLEIDDVLEGGDSDFFDGGDDQNAYFDLINEIRKPGSTKSGRTLVLYTARPVGDRSRYENATTIPGNVFLTTSEDDALGMAEDLGGERDVWEVRMDSQYLVRTLDAPKVQHYQVVREAPVDSIHMVSEPRTAAPKKPKTLKVLPRPTRNLPGRTKNLAPWNKYNVNKLMDDILREYYYTFRGYEGPHPWGIRAKPPIPEYRPLKVVDESAGAAYRHVIQTHLKNPKVRQRFLRTLLELQMLLRGVDPNNPKLVKRRQVSVAAVKDREYLESLNLKQLQKTQKPAEGQDKREFYQGLQQEAKKGPVFEEWILKDVEAAPDLSKPLTKWLGTIAQNPKEAIKLKDVDLNLIAEWMRKSPSAGSRIEKMSVDDLKDAYNDWKNHGDEPQGEFEKNKIVHTFKDGWTVVELETENDILREGEIVQNCLKQPSMGWYDRVKSGKSRLYSLRTPANSPRVDIEVQYVDYVAQVYGKQNKVPQDKYSAHLSEFFVAYKLYSGLLKIPNVTLPPEAVAGIPQNEKVKLAGNPDSADQLLDLLADDEDVEIRKLVVNNRNTAMATVEKLTNDPDDWVKGEAQSRVMHHHPDQPVKRSQRSTDPNELRELAKVDVSAVRINIAYNSHTPQDVLHDLSIDDLTSVRMAMARRADLSEDLLRFLAKDLDSDVVVNVALRNDLPADVLADLATHNNTHVRRAVAKSDDIPDDILLLLSKDKSSIVRAAVAGNENTPARILTNLSDDNNDEVLYYVARNHNTRPNVLKDLADHEDTNIADEARSTLEEVYGLRI